MEIVENIFGSITRAIGLIIFAASAMFVGWAAFQYMTAQGDPQAQMKARNQMIGVGIAMVLGGFAGFAPGFFNDLILRPAGIGVDTASAICDDHLKTVINPRTGSFGATSGQVNDAILEVQTRYPEECHYTNWNVAAEDDQDFSGIAGDNQCFSATQGGGGGAEKSNRGEPLYVGRVTVPTAFYDAVYDIVGDPPILEPRDETRRDSAGNVIVFFATDALPLDGSHCWLFRAGRLNQWFSNRDQ